MKVDLIFVCSTLALTKQVFQTLSFQASNTYVCLDSIRSQEKGTGWVGCELGEGELPSVSFGSKIAIFGAIQVGNAM